MKSILFVLFLASSSSATFLGLPIGRHLSETQCPIKLYNPKDSSFTGVKLYTNTDTFHPLLDVLSRYAKRCRVKIHVTRAFTSENLLLKSNNHLPLAFYLGEAIEFNLVDQQDRMLCDRSCLRKNLSQLKSIPKAKCFMRKIKRNRNFQRDHLKSMILMKQNKDKKSLINNDDKDQRKFLQQQCKNLDLS